MADSSANSMMPPRLLSLADLIQAIELSYRDWDALCSQATDEQWQHPLQPDGWSLKDTLAHLCWYENEMACLLETRTLAGSELWLLPASERNQRIDQLYRPRSLDEIRAESHRNRQRILSALAGFSTQQLLDPAAFAQMPADWQPLDIIIQNTCDHYAEHIASLKASLIPR